MHVESRGERLRAAAVVCAVPWYALADLFAGETAAIDHIRHAAVETKASAIASVNVWLDRPVLTSPFLGLPGRTFQWVFDKGQLFEGPSHLTLVSSGADRLMTVPNQELIDLALRELRDALPDARAAKVERASAFRERRATFSLAPGQPSRPDTRTAVNGLYLAGDWVDTGLPATIESAVISGRRVAELAS